MDKTRDLKRFADTMLAMCELYGKDLSKPALALWWELLADYPIEDVERGVRACMRSPDHGQFMPKPADVIRAIEGTSADRAVLAWGRVVEAMRLVGAYRSVAFDDIAIHAAVQDLGGWAHLCRQGLDEMPFLQKRFVDAYKAAQGKPAPGYLPGQFEAENALRGYDVAPPVLIGDPARAEANARLGRVTKSAIGLTAGAVKALQ